MVIVAINNEHVLKDAINNCGNTKHMMEKQCSSMSPLNDYHGDIRKDKLMEYSFSWKNLPNEARFPTFLSS